MNLVSRNRNNFSTPARFRSNLLDEPFERLVNTLFEDFLAPVASQDLTVATPRVNLTETDKTFELEVEVPGVTKDDLKIAADSRRVSIEAETKRESERKEGETVVYAERAVRKFARSFTLPAEVDEANVQAKLDNGILRLTLPKKEAAHAKMITVQ